MPRYLICILLIAGCAGSGSYHGSATVYGSSPDLVYVSPGVQVIADYDEPIFYTDGYYWRYYNDTWYRSNYYNRGWSYSPAPRALLRIDRPRSYVRYRPQGYVSRRPVRDNRPAYRDNRPVNRDHRGTQPYGRDNRPVYRAQPQTRTDRGNRAQPQTQPRTAPNVPDAVRRDGRRDDRREDARERDDRREDRSDKRRDRDRDDSPSRHFRRN